MATKQASKEPAVSQYTNAAIAADRDDAPMVEFDTARYRWNLRDGDRTLRGYLCDMQSLPDGKGDEYTGFIVYTTRVTTAKNDKGDVVTVPPGTFVVLSQSDGLRPVMNTLRSLALDPLNAHVIEVSPSHKAKTAKGFEVIKCTIKQGTSIKRSELPPTPSFGMLADDGYEAPQLPTNGAVDAPSFPAG